MIWDSNPWKRDLRKCSHFLQRLSAQSRPLTEQQLFSVERRIFLAFYSIRKLLEAHKLTDSCTQQQTAVKVYPPTGKPITHFNWHRSDEHFDFTAPRVERWSLVKLCHQFVHSYVFHIVDGETGGLSGFFIASDRQRTEGLLDIDVNSVIAICQSVAADDISTLHWTRDPKTGKETFAAS
jgi:hypothetical protein